MAYRYELLRPTRAIEAKQKNANILAADCFGIEVTEPESAACCVLGNLDPQHLGVHSDLSVVEAALDVSLPPSGATLVTIRPDADAYGAMAVLSLRAEGQRLSAEARRRIGHIGKADRHDHGHWPGPRPLPESAADVDEIGPGPDGLGALHAGLTLASTSIDEGVRLTRQWILSGETPVAWAELARRAAGALTSSLVFGAVVVREAVKGHIAVVEGAAPGALRLGYRVAPIVVAVNEPSVESNRSARKLTIAQHDPDWVDLVSVARFLSDDEPGWGGTRTIVGAPQGISCVTTIQRCINVLHHVSTKGILASVGGGRLCRAR